MLRSLLFLLFTALGFHCKNIQFTILHNNDLHGRFEETARNSGTCKNLTPRDGPITVGKGCVGGFARIAHEIRKYRNVSQQGGNPVLYLNAGDTYVGTSWFAVHRANISVEFMNLLRPDVACLGNHEFDYRPENLVPFVNAANFPIVAANLDFKNVPTLSKVKKSVVLDVGGRKVGVVGHLTNETLIISSPGEVIFNDVVESVRKETEELNKQGVNIIIVLGHSGFLIDKMIAKEVPFADIVIGGHTNTFLYNGKPPDSEQPEGPYPTVVVQTNGKKVPVVQAYAFSKYLGILNVTFNDDGDLIDFGGQPELLDTNVPQDLDVLDKLEFYRAGVSELNNKVVGKSAVMLEFSSCRTKECNFANFITDSFVFYMASQYVGEVGWTEYPIGLINGGGIRNVIDPTSNGGKITRGEILAALPYENDLIALTLSGKELWETLEIGLRSNGETSKGEFLQVSGLHVVYNMTKPSLSRVVSVKVRCGNCSVPKYEPIDLNKTYKIVTTAFLAGGGDGHSLLKHAANKKSQEMTDGDSVVSYLSKHSLIYPGEEERIIFIKKIDNDKPSGQDRIVFNQIIMISLILGILPFR